MIRSTRATVAVGLGLLGVAALVGSTMGQQPQDSKVRQAAAAANAAPAPAPGSTLIGSIDLDFVMKNYDRVKVASENFTAETMERSNTLMKMYTEGKQEADKLSRMTPGSPDAKKCEDKIVQLKAQIEAGKENAQREFAQKEAEMMATIYNEIQAMAKGVAKQRGMAFVVRYTDQLPSGNEPNTVASAMSRTILYADERVDITPDVVKWLNYRYKASGGPAPKNTGPIGTSPAGAGTGAGAPGTGRPAAPASMPSPGGPGGN